MNPDHELVLRFLAGEVLAGPIGSSPLIADLGGVLVAADPAGRVSLAFAPGERYLQGSGVVQGGIVTAMLDFAMAFAAFTLLPRDKATTTVSLNIDFLRAAKPGRYLAHGRVRRLGARIAFVEADLMPAGESDVTASATGTMAVFAA